MEQRPAAHSTEACIGRKLQLIGDQFHREHLQQVRGGHQGVQLPHATKFKETVSAVSKLT